MVASKESKIINTPNEAILDTKILTLFIIGLIDPDYITKFVGTKEFSRQDFEKLTEFLNQFNKIIITPHVLAEFSHFTLEQKSFRDDYKKVLKEVITRLGSKTDERFIKLASIFSNSSIFFLGVTDISIMESSNVNGIVISSDGPLVNKLLEAGKNAIKFLPVEGFRSY